MRCLLATLGATLCLMWGSFAYGQEARLPDGAPDVSAATLFEAGHYSAALAAVEGVRSADAHAFAARVMLSQAIVGDGEPDAGVLADALAAADAALVLDAGHLEGRMQKAIALSMLSRPMSVREARRSGNGPLARDLARSVLADDPDNFYAHGFLSVWHIEVRRRGGRIGAAMLGASLGDAATHYAAAVAQSPDDASVRWQYARSLAALDARRHGDVVRAELEAACDAPTETALERVMQDRARLLLTALEAGDMDAVEAMAAGML